ncbi:MAG: hypothetical protein RIQ60_4311 [Pseudomonadota bacterium]|jgi:uncharacterized membrane protein (UPF0127 family)
MIHIKTARRPFFTTTRAQRVGVRALAGLAGAVMLGLAALLATPAQAQGGPQNLPIIRIGAGMMSLKVELADTPAARQIGLMHRSSMPTNDGMLFVFERAEMSCFWMRNTLIPLSIAFLADDGSIVNIADMKPLDETSHCPTKPVRLALEMNQGWFVRHGLKAGDKLSGEVFKPR